MKRTKIFELADLSKQLESLKKSGKTIAHCHGVFDLVHPGHVRHFAEARKLADFLVVTITKDQYVNKGPGRPVFPEALRAEALAALEDIDFVAINETPTAVEAIRAVKPTFYVKGADYENRAADVTKGIYAEEQAVKDGGGKIHFTHDITFSSTNLLNTHFSPYPEAAKSFLRDVKSRISADAAVAAIQKWRSLKVLVIGEAIVDEYAYCETLPKSPRENAISARTLSTERYTGGAVAAANHLANFSDQVSVLSVVGEDSTLLKPAEKVQTKFFTWKNQKTITKRRYLDVASSQKLFQDNQVPETSIPSEMENEIVRFLRENLFNYDLVIATDYGHGLLTKEIRATLEAKAKRLALSVQVNSANFGYNLLSKYQRSDFVFLEEIELRLLQQDKEAPLEELLRRYWERNSKSTVVCLKSSGSLLLRTPQEKNPVAIPSLALRSVDRMGARDAAVSLSSLAWASDSEAAFIGLVGSAAFTMAAEEMGNRKTLESPAFVKFVKALLG